jgi:hypothetical protein
VDLLQQLVIARPEMVLPLEQIMRGVLANFFMHLEDRRSESRWSSHGTLVWWALLARPHGIGERLEPDDVILQLSPQFPFTRWIVQLLKPRVLSRQIRRFA